MARLATFSAFMLLAGSATAQGVARGSAATVRAWRSSQRGCLRCASRAAGHAASRLCVRPQHARLSRARQQRSRAVAMAAVID
jgi:hypothetical protein